jgi:hypothetical protein
MSMLTEEYAVAPSSCSCIEIIMNHPRLSRDVTASRAHVQVSVRPHRFFTYDPVPTRFHITR